MYHGLGSVDIDPWGLFVSADNFEGHLAVMTDGAQPMPLDALVAAAANGDLPPRAVAITSDDGYANIATTGRPLLERHGVPATLFALSAPLTDGGEFWWDRLAAIILVPGDLPDHLRLGVGPDGVDIELGRAVTYTEAQWRTDHLHRDGDQPGPRMALYLQLWKLLLPWDHRRRRQTLQALAEWAGAPEQTRPTYRSLTPGELADLDGDTVTVGGHTLTHPLLPDLCRRERRREIDCNKRHLEEILNRPVTTFSYPFGGHDNKTVAAVRSAGYRVAVTTKPSLVDAHSHRLRIGRYDVKDWTADEFARRLDQWFRS